MKRPADERELIGRVRSAAADGLSKIATVLSVASNVAQTAARQLNPPAREAAGDETHVVTPGDTDAGSGPVHAGPIDTGPGPVDPNAETLGTTRGSADVGPGPVGPVGTDETGAASATGLAPPEPPPTEPAADVRSRTPASDIVELADRSAREVVAAVDRLSTDELRQLYEYESSHKRRKTVLAAIEKAAGGYSSSG